MLNHKYRIALCNVFWTEEDINTRFFSSIEEQNTYFDSLTAGKFSSLSNFNMGNNINTAITYRDDSDRSVEELVACNYAVVQKYDEETGVILSRRYFFAYPQQDSGRQMRVTLSLDDIQTNYFRYKDKIAPCMINRACLNRWVDNNDGTVSFNGNIDSNLFVKESFQGISKRLSSRIKTSLNNFSNPEIKQWFDNNIIAWNYVFLDSTHAYKFFLPNSQPSIGQHKLPTLKYYGVNANKNTNTLKNNIDGRISCVCVPIYKENANALLFNNQACIPASIDAFLDENEEFSFVIANKISIIPPFVPNENGEFDISGEILENGNLNISFQWYEGGYFQTETNMPIALYNDATQQINGSIFMYCKQLPLYLTNNIDLPYQLTFNKGEIVNSSFNLKYNPKLLGSDFVELVIRTSRSEGFSFNIQKLNKTSIKLKYYEPLTPDISRFFLTIEITDENGVYIKEISDNFTGAVGDFDSSLSLSTSAYSSMVAQNKNFYLQYLANRNKNIADSFISGGLNILTKQPFGAISSFVGGISSFAMSELNMKLNIDNMKNAPGSVEASKGNAILPFFVSDEGIFIEIYDILPIDKKEIGNYLNNFGFSLAIVDNISNYDNIRYYFNYIEANVEAITAPISNIEKDRLRKRLQSVRFWNSDTIQYSQENYERSIV